MSSGIPNNIKGRWYKDGTEITPTVTQLNQMAITWGTGISTALQANVGSAGAPVTFNGAGGTPSSLTLTNATGLPIGGTTGYGTGVATALAINIGSAGAMVLFNGAGGTPSSMTGTNITGTAAGLTAGVASAVAVGGITGLGTGVATALAVNTGSAGAIVLFNGAGGTPSSLTLTNATGLPIGGTTGYGTGVATALAVNVGSAGAFVTFNGAGGTPSSLTLTNATGLPIAGTTGYGTGVATALAVNVGSAGAFVTFNGAGGTPSSLVLTNATGDKTGTTTNDSAATGKVGEYIESIITQGSGTGLTASTNTDITSISLTAGDWDVSGNISFLTAATTAITDLNGWISTTSASLPAGNLRSQRAVAVAFTPGVANESFCVPHKRISIAGTTTVYLSCRASFATSTLEGSGQIWARRVR